MRHLVDVYKEWKNRKEEPNAHLPSLFIIGHPRGLSSVTWKICCRATNLNVPTAASKGEILNHQLNLKIEAYPHFTKSEKAYYDYKNTIQSYLRGYCVKDVVQPFVVLRYIREHPDDFRILYVYRDPDIVNWRQRERGWQCPHPSTFVADFKRAADAVLTFEQVVSEPQVVFSTLAMLGYTVKPYNYRTLTFRREVKKQQRLLREFFSRRREAGEPRS